MNGFIQNNKQFFSLALAAFLGNSLCAVTFRNEPLTNFVTPGKILYADFPEDICLLLEIENDNFDIKEINITDLQGLQEVFEDATNTCSGGFRSGKSLHLSSNIMNYTGSCLAAEENINLTARTSGQFNRCIFESPFISITGNKLNFDDCFLLEPEILNIVINHPESDYKVIQIIFHEQPEQPTIITGGIDLTDSESKKRLIISNVKEVRMQFAWKEIAPQAEANSGDVSSSDKTTTTQKTQPKATAFLSNLYISTLCLALIAYGAYHSSITAQ